MEDLTGRQFGPYQVVAPLGEGGMAAVYKAYQPAMERYVAVKILPRHFADDAQFVARFQREAKLLAQLQHPHILPVFDSGQADGYSYIVMPLVQAGTLTDLLGGSPIPLPRLRQVHSQVGEALDYAHRRGFVHRDVKPSNILIDESGNCLLTDFGLARMVEATANLTTSGTVMGTPAYMSPEQGMGGKIDGRSDIYSLGVVLYEMATGRVPYRAETPVAVVFKHVHDPLPGPRTLNPDLPEAVERVILKALSKRPEDRFETAGHMVRALQVAIPESHVTQAATVVHDAVKPETPSPPPAARRLASTLVPRKKPGVPFRTVVPIGAAMAAVAVGIAYWVFGPRATPQDLLPTSVPAAATTAPASPSPSARAPTASPLPPSPIPLRPEVLEATGTMLMGQGLLAVNKRYGFEFQSSGDLVVRDYVTDKVLWSSETRADPGAYLVMQDDGNLVLFTKGGDPLWSTDTPSTRGDYYLSMQSDGNLVIYQGKAYAGGSQVPIWASKSAG